MLFLFILLINSTSSSVSFCGEQFKSDVKVIQCHQNLQAKDFDTLEQFKELTVLDLSNSNIQSIKPLLGLSKLNCLSIQNTDVKELKGIRKLQKIRELNLQGSFVHDLKELIYLRELNRVFIDTMTKENTNTLLHIKSLAYVYMTKAKKIEDLRWKQITPHVYRSKENKEAKPSSFILNLRRMNNITLKDSVIHRINKKDFIYFILMMENKNSINRKLNQIVIDYFIEKSIGINYLDEYLSTPLDYALNNYFVYSKGTLQRVINGDINRHLVKKLREKGALRSGELLGVIAVKRFMYLVNYILNFK